MKVRAARFPMLAAAVALCAAGTVVAVHGDGETAAGVLVPASIASAPPDVSAATVSTQVAPSVAASAETPTTEAATPPEAPTPQPTTVARAAPVLARSEPGASPTDVAPKAPVAPPTFTSLEVLNRSRDVLLPSGKAFADCVMIGAESGPWNFQIHDYWNLDGTWTVETHSGDVGLIFVEATQNFRVRNVNRSGC